MTKLPREGGSYRRGKDGELNKVEATEPAPATGAEARPAKPAPDKRSK